MSKPSMPEWALAVWSQCARLRGLQAQPEGLTDRSLYLEIVNTKAEIMSAVKTLDELLTKADAGPMSALPK